MNEILIGLIRAAHVVASKRPLPARVAVYFHALERGDLPAFEEAITYLRDLGYAAVTPQAYCAQGGRERQVFISFDDNFRSWHSALDLLARLGVTATFYVNTQPFRDTASGAEIERYFRRIAHDGERVTLSRGELAEIASAGHNVGCHSHSHAVLSRWPREGWDDEILTSKSILEDLLDREVSDFSFPYGMRRHFSGELRAYCGEIGFKTVATGLPGLQHATPIDPMSINRTSWKFDRSLQHNIENLKIDARLYAQVTGRSAIG